MQRRIIRVCDVDGVLSDSVRSCHLATVRAHKHFGLNAPSLRLYRECNSSDGFRGKKLALGVPEDKLKDYDACWWEIYCKILRKDPPQMVPGMKEKVERLASRGERLALLSMAGEMNTDIQIGLAWARSVFKDLMFVKSDKAAALTGYKTKTPGCEIYYFGDMIMDGVACVKAKVRFGAMISQHSHSSEDSLLEFVRAHRDMSVAVHGARGFARFPGRHNGQ